MGFSGNIVSAVLSLVAFLLTLAIFAVPAMATYVAVTYGFMGKWAYVPLAGVLLVGAALAVVFLRKALNGVLPWQARV